MTRVGRTESFRAARTGAMARGVKGGVRARRESLVVCDFRWVAEAERRGRGRGDGGVAVGGGWNGVGWTRRGRW